MRSLSWSSLLLLLCFLWSATCHVSVNGKVYAILGSNATIKCTDVTLAWIREITWQREVGGKTESFITYTTETGPRSLTWLASRVKFLADGSIEIPNVTLDDEGTYKQVITMLPSMVLECKIYLQVQVFPIIHVVPELDPVMVGCLEETVGICIARAAKPPAAIDWRTGDLAYSVEESETRHENGTVTTQSVLKMIPEWKINGINVTCIVLQEDAMSDIQTERTVTIRNIHCK
ncbi:hypothetical protein GDO78_019375 [Eleutherodactylus coqui]|uniref:Immunoglobulin domain-containing protein n=1 Tax=Eleutherodactylus coqui TaxID=57060 RepID=A0A8J6BKV8_ELECQ|nr:hypothetical protein GDO78_019375 [Eleutherodactylus coqui]